MNETGCWFWIDLLLSAAQRSESKVTVMFLGGVTQSVIPHGKSDSSSDMCTIPQSVQVSHDHWCIKKIMKNAPILDFH